MNCANKMNHTRFCVECGHKIFGFALEKPEVCPNGMCRAKVPLHLDAFKFVDGWGRCPLCYMYIKADDSYCQLCKTENPKLIATKRRKLMADYQQRECQQQRIMSQMTEELEQNRRMIADLQKQLAVQSSSTNNLTQEEKKLVRETMEGVELTDLEENDLLVDDDKNEPGSKAEK